MNNKEIAAELTKAYIQAYVNGVFADPHVMLQAKTGAIHPDNFVSVYKKFYNALSNIPDEK